MSHDAHKVGHVVSLKILFGVLAVLLVLTFVTVAVTWVDLGPLNLIVALVIALIKATLVGLYFMHLRWDRPINGIILVTSLALVVLFLGFALIDSGEYQTNLVPGDAPSMALEPDKR